MKELFEFFQSFGATAIDFIWFPVIMWSLAASLVFLVLKWAQSLNPLYHYHLRLATLFALPVGIISSLIYNQITSSLSAGEKTSGAFFIVENPISNQTLTQSSEPIFQPDWLEANFLVGLVTSLLLVTGFMLLLKLLYNFYQLRLLYSNLKQTEYINGTAMKVRLAFQEHLFVPFTFGWKNPVIVLPTSMKSDPKKMKVAINHELIHIERGDYLFQIGLSVIRSLFWFHPLVLFAHKETEIYREISCDQHLLSITDISPKNYADILFELTLQRTRVNDLYLYMAQNQSTLKHRIKVMKHHKPETTSLKNSFLFLLLTLIIVTIPISCSDLKESDISEIEQPEQVLTPKSNLSNNAQTPAADVFVVVEQQPELIGGLKSLQSKISYPEKALENKIEGRVVLQFIVDKNGDVQNPKIIRGIGYGCDEEALRAVKEAKFHPGVQRGEPVDVQFSLPIIFKLSDSQSQSFNDVKLIKKPLFVDFLESSDGVLTVKVTQENGAPLADANVTLTNINLGTATGTDGIATITDLERKEYDVRVSYIGYEDFHNKKITIN